jgi:phospholipase C
VDWRAYSQGASTLWLFPSLRGREEMLSFDHFVAHARGGTLPAVSWVEPAFGINDDHPPVHPMLGQLFLSTVYRALATSPLWDRTLLVVYYDEHGGFYDHVPPPKAPDDRAAQGFDQLGFRVPTMAIGPWVRPGACVRTTLEHTSVLAHIEREYDLEPLTARTEAAEDLWSLIDVDRLAANQPLAPVELPVITMTEDEIEDQCRMARGKTLAQPLLEALLDRIPAPAHLDRRHELDQVLREQLAHAIRLGALRVS